VLFPAVQGRARDCQWRTDAEVSGAVKNKKAFDSLRKCSWHRCRKPLLPREYIVEVRQGTVDGAGIFPSTSELLRTCHYGCVGGGDADVMFEELMAEAERVGPRPSPSSGRPRWPERCRVCGHYVTDATPVLQLVDGKVSLSGQLEFDEVIGLFHRLCYGRGFYVPSLYPRRARS